MITLNFFPSQRILEMSMKFIFPPLGRDNNNNLPPCVYDKLKHHQGQKPHFIEKVTDFLRLKETLWKAISLIHPARMSVLVGAIESERETSDQNSALNSGAGNKPKKLGREAPHIFLVFMATNYRPKG